MKFIHTKIKNAGNTIIEILIATVVVGLILTSLAVSMTSSIQNSAEAQYRESGTRLAQDVMEVFRKDKNTLSWNSFYATPASGTYCVPSSFSSITSLTTGANLNIMDLCPFTLQSNMNYYRAVTKLTGVTATNVPYVKVTVYVYWNVRITGKERFTSVQQTFYKNY